MTKEELTRAAENRKAAIQSLLSDPYKLRLKKPFFRGSERSIAEDTPSDVEVQINKSVQAVLPSVTKTVVSQSQFVKELDPQSHTVLFDENMPSICVKVGSKKGGEGYQEIEFRRVSLNFQERIRQKKTLTLCGNKRFFSLNKIDPNEEDAKRYASFRNGWRVRNQDGMGSKAVYTQLGYGDVGLLMYYDYKGRIKSRILSYEDGYVICPHNDANGDRLLDCVYYKNEDNIECLDCYDDTYMYRLRRIDPDIALANGWKVDEKSGWSRMPDIKHGFSESPLITKRGNVAWNDVQGLIDTYETLYNIFIVIEKRHGWGILYIKGKFKEQAQKIAGSIILNDTSLEGNGSAEFKTPPSPEHTIETLKTLFNNIQIGSSCTFLLPEDIRSTGDISALAIMLTQSLDLEGGAQAIIDWQNFLSKQVRLFKEGWAHELVLTGEDPHAITEYAKLDIDAKFTIWRPFNEHEFNQMLIEMKQAGIISAKTSIERNTISEPDETQRLERQAEEEEEKQRRQQEAQAAIKNTTTANE